MQELLTKVMQKTGISRSKAESDSGDEVTPLDIIYSCCVCNATFSEAYENGNDAIEMLSDGINPKDRPPTRLFLSNCCHVFCAKHLDGGGMHAWAATARHWHANFGIGAPFHPAGKRPYARCPVCAKDSELYAMRGFGRGEFDPAIPECFFKIPPVALDSKGKESEALRVSSGQPQVRF